MQALIQCASLQTPRPPLGRKYLVPSSSHSPFPARPQTGDHQSHNRTAHQILMAWVARVRKIRPARSKSNRHETLAQTPHNSTTRSLLSPQESARARESEANHREHESVRVCNEPEPGRIVPTRTCIPAKHPVLVTAHQRQRGALAITQAVELGECHAVAAAPIQQAIRAVGQPGRQLGQKRGTALGCHGSQDGTVPEISPVNSAPHTHIRRVRGSTTPSG